MIGALRSSQGKCQVAADADLNTYVTACQVVAGTEQTHLYLLLLFIIIIRKIEAASFAQLYYYFFNESSKFSNHSKIMFSFILPYPINNDSI